MHKPHYYAVHWRGPEKDAKGRFKLHTKDFKAEDDARAFAAARAVAALKTGAPNPSVYAATVENVSGIGFAHLDKLK
jgi:hypothetical protein